MARLYADEDFHHRVVDELRNLGHDVLTAEDAGQAHQQISDEKVLAHAITAGRIVITHNRRDFIRLHKKSANHLGIIVCTRDPDVMALAERVHAAIVKTPDLDGKLVRINLPSKP
ncbi:MAG: hypothetical protein FJ271_15305 [Planctomycetes bacterium]|nr:hypothetical protein [Planctomycetota bacterium]